MIRLTAVIEMEGRSPLAVTKEFTGPEFYIGRDVDADFHVPLSTISRRHARISETDQVYLIEDLGSTHGTILNGRRMEPGEKKVLRNGDLIELTKARITCDIDEGDVVTTDAFEGTQAIASRAVQQILGQLGEAQGEGPYFRVLTGADEGARFALDISGSAWTMGRASECEFVLNDPNVSRRHARVKKDWSGFIIEDLGSKNGVVIGDKRIEKPRRLQDRDEITVGPVKLLFIDPDADLMAALRDVPGFEQEDDEFDDLGDDASHMGVPSEGEDPDEDEELGEGDADDDEEEDSEGEEDDDDEDSEGEEDADLADSAGLEDQDSPTFDADGLPEDEGIEDYSEIDPGLLELETKRFGDWLVIGFVLFIILATLVLLFALLP